MLFALVAGALVQAGLPYWTAMGHAKPPIVLGIILYYAMNQGLRMALQGAVIGGVLQDGLSLMPLGFSCLAFCAVVLVTRRFRDLVFSHEGMTHALVGAAAAVGSTLILYGLLFLVDGNQGGVGQVLLRALGSGLLALLVVPLVFRLMTALDERLGHLKPRYA
jgi:rod shape-determining protein MreD